VMEKKDEFFSLLVFKDITARHSGKYTCYATNSAAKVNYTAELFVKGTSRKCNQLVAGAASKTNKF
jgi:Down syndrome cell adhesion molecule